MWNKPHLLNALADLLFVAGLAALLAAAAVWLVRMPALPIRQVVFAQELQHVRRLDVEQALPAALKGNFFSINLEAVRGALEKLPWVRKVEVRRVWPAKLEVRVEEHRAAARWEDGRNPGRGELVNTYGEIFPAALAEEEVTGLPRLYGPLGTAPELLKRYGEFTAAFRPVGQKPVQLVQSPRLAWQLKLDNGMVVDLGREQPKAPLGARLQRFVEVYPAMVAARPALPSAVDLRYPNGFAMRVAGPEVKGK
ncbi:MAG TPA: cell division protein FtsQ/DivIB [Rhodocyclaceae bacterium]|nr:cell division protein FtsQ/DivIB [Rhodocyclaceae bacterium]